MSLQKISISLGKSKAQLLCYEIIPNVQSCSPEERFTAGETRPEVTGSTEGLVRSERGRQQCKMSQEGREGQCLWAGVKTKTGGAAGFE